MALIDISEVKAELGIPDAITQENEPVQRALLAAQATLLRMTRFRLSADTIVDTFNEVRLGTPLALSARPIDTVATIAVEARQVAKDASPTTLAHDVTDAFKGIVYTVSSDDSFVQQVFPPQDPPAPWYRWRDFTWPIVTVEYDVVPLDLTSSDLRVKEAATVLRHTLAGFVAFLFEQSRARNLRSQQIGRISEEYLDRHMPDWIRGQLAPWCESAGTADAV